MEEEESEVAAWVLDEVDEEFEMLLIGFDAFSMGFP